ncbi:heavy metal-binding domain-containing protein [Adhaeribacter aquaticus]|uniref:heavy metal-binding domain-containing protein n=1 Tax=Adhaeribacter aquaticus TaxID=299567 RepID=UPI00041ABDDB|nr:heavy metal-binding domain-containing protein [Adhaeribacter aquaticus]
MKTSFLNISLFILGLTFFTACNNTSQTGTTQTQSPEQTETKQEVAGLTYTCPMHPEVISNEPGKCPKCGMFLEKMGATTEGHEEHNH